MVTTCPVEYQTVPLPLRRFRATQNSVDTPLKGWYFHWHSACEKRYQAHEQPEQPAN